MVASWEWQPLFNRDIIVKKNCQGTHSLGLWQTPTHNLCGRAAPPPPQCGLRPTDSSSWSSTVTFPAEPQQAHEDTRYDSLHMPHRIATRPSVALLVTMTEQNADALLVTELMQAAERCSVYFWPPAGPATAICANISCSIHCCFLPLNVCKDASLLLMWHPTQEEHLPCKYKHTNPAPLHCS